MRTRYSLKFLDQESNRGVYTQEANAECDKIMKSKKYFINTNGKNIRLLSAEAIQALYELTRD